MPRKPRYPVEPPRSIQPISSRGWKRIWATIIVYLALCVWAGYEAAFYMIAFGAFVCLWAIMCRRFPWLAYATGLFFATFIGGFIMGLLGVRGGGYYSYYDNRRYRR